MGSYKWYGNLRYIHKYNYQKYPRKINVDGSICFMVHKQTWMSCKRTNELYPLKAEPNEKLDEIALLLFIVFKAFYLSPPH